MGVGGFFVDLLVLLYWLSSLFLFCVFWGVGGF